jgi:lipopolysaccharide biosynthesis regulator YciM
MIELSPLLLAFAFIVVGGIAWGLGHGRGMARTVRLPRDYYVGLDHLINDRFDRAAEVFARMAEVDGDAVEIQFALGSVFRRRGEVDRAIAIHTRLRGDATAAVAQRGAFALALDYSSAGLMDRAERLFEELAATREYRHAALDHLVRIHEQAGDWANALRVFHELPSAVQSERRRVAAHYLCELAEQAVLQGDAARAQTLLKQARAHDEDLPRAQISHGTDDRRSGRHERRARPVPGRPRSGTGACARDHSPGADAGWHRRRNRAPRGREFAPARDRARERAPARLAARDRGAGEGASCQPRARCPRCAPS